MPVTRIIKKVTGDEMTEVKNRAKFLKKFKPSFSIKDMFVQN